MYARARARARLCVHPDIYNAVTILFAVVISIPIAKTTEVQEAKEADYRHAQVLMLAMLDRAAHSTTRHTSIALGPASLPLLVGASRA